MKNLLFAVVLAAIFASCNNHSGNVPQSIPGNESEDSVLVESSANQKEIETPQQTDAPVEKSNRQKMIDALNLAAIEYGSAMSEEDLNCTEAKLKSEISSIQGNCTINEIKEINNDEEYNDAWKKCMEAYENSADRLGLL